MAPRISSFLTKCLGSVALLLASGACAFASEGGGHEVAPLLKTVMGVPVTNSILTSWVITILIILVVRWMVGKPTLVPSRGQAIVEEAITGLRDLYEPIVGKKAMPMAFPVLLTLFVFIVLHNWSGLLPFVGTMGWENVSPETPLWKLGGSHFIPLIRPHTSELNGTIALAIVSFVAWFIIVMRYAGPGLLIKDLFGNKADKKELAPAMYWGLSLVFIVVGLIEVVSIFIRPVTLSMRLFGNVFGGENLLHAMHFLPPFYFLELLVGFVQALVFTLLTAVYIGLICNHDDHSAEEHDAPHEPGHVKEAAH